PIKILVAIFCMPLVYQETGNKSVGCLLAGKDDLRYHISMVKNDIPGGVVHKMPADLKKALSSEPKALAAWRDITPLARNEWICWVVTVKRPETRIDHIKRTVVELQEGKRRPCCWIGCIH